MYVFINKERIFKMQKFFAYFIWFLFVLATLYLMVFIWQLILPILLVLFGLSAFRIYQIRKTWNDLIKQSQKDNAKQRSFKKVSDDNVIDVEYEEIK